MSGLEHIGKRDVVWSYGATAFTIGAGVILLPFILHKLPAETIAVWNIFQTITVLVTLLDFGFRHSFVRNVSYVFSGVKSLQINGVEAVEQDNAVDYSLLKGTIHAMRKFYGWMGLALFVLLLTAGTAYFVGIILPKYTGERMDALVAWGLLITINSYNLFTFYYDCLLLGKGYVRRIQQFTVIGQATYLIVAIVLIYCGLGLTAIVSAQVLSVVIRRVLAKRTFFNKAMRKSLAAVQEQDAKEIMRVTTPNAIKVGLTQLGGFMINRSSLLLGSAFLDLKVIASYGLTLQVIDIIERCGVAYYQTYIPKLAQYRAERDIVSLWQKYKYSVLSLAGVFVVGGIGLVFMGDWALQLIKSETVLLPMALLLGLLLVRFLEQNHALATGFLMADNKIPFFIPSLVSGAAVVLVLWVMLQFTSLGAWALILAPGLVQLAYQNWKWPLEVIKDLKGNRL